MILVVVATAVAGALLAPAALRAWVDRVRPWYTREVDGRLRRLGLARWTGQPRLPLLVVGLGAATGLWLGAGPGLLLGGLAAAGAVALAPRLLDARIHRLVEVADRQVVELLPEVAVGVARGESPERLLGRIAASVGGVGTDGDARWSPLVRDLVERAAAAARLAPSLDNACAVLAAAEVPTARLWAVAWRQAPVGVDVPGALRELATVAGAELDFRREIAGRVAPIRSQSLGMAAVPALMLGVLALQDRETARALFTFPEAWALVVGGGCLVAALAWLRAVLVEVE